MIELPAGHESLTALKDLRLMPYRERIRKATIQQLEAHPELAEMPAIYMASKAHHRPRWRVLRDASGFNIVSSWIDTPDEYSTDPTGLDYRRLWAKCVADVHRCDTLVVYVESGEHMKGALVEVGVALGLGKEVIITGDLGDNGTWAHHERVQTSDKTVEELLGWIYGS